MLPMNADAYMPPPPPPAQTPLTDAIYARDYEEVKRLLEEGADPNEIPIQEGKSKGTAPLNAASCYVDIVKLLIAHGATVRERHLEKIESRLDSVLADLKNPNVIIKNSMIVGLQCYKSLKVIFENELNKKGVK